MKVRKSHRLSLIGAVLFSLSTVATAVAQQSDTVTVSGETVSTASITLNTESVTFGQITSPGRKETTAPVTGSVSTTFSGAQPTVKRTVTGPPPGFSGLLVNTGSGLGAVQDSTVPDPSAISDIYYIQISGTESARTFSFTVTYSISTV